MAKGYNFVRLRGFLAVFDLAQIINLLWISIKKRSGIFIADRRGIRSSRPLRLFGRTPRDIRDWTQPPDFEYAVY